MHLNFTHRYFALIVCFALLQGNAIAQPQRPEITNLDGTSITYRPSEDLRMLDGDQNTQLLQGSAPDLFRAMLTTRFLSGDVSGEDQLILRLQAPLSVQGFDVLHNGVKFGTLSGGSNGESMVIRFNENANQQNISSLIRNVSYVNAKPDNPTVGQRMISMSFRDGYGGLSNTAVVTINVQTGNRPPTANALYYSVPASAPLTVPGATGLLSFNNDPDGDPMTVMMHTGALHGSLTLSPDGSFTYVPATGFTGLDSLQYIVTDGHNPGSGIASVVFHVGSVNVDPEAKDAYFTVYAGHTLFVPRQNSILLGLNDPNSGNLRIFGKAAVPVQPPNGTIKMSPYGNFVYTPNPGFRGREVIAYTHCDAQGRCANAQITIDVIQNLPPVAEHDSNESYFNIMTGNVLTNDSDPEGDALTASLVTAPVNGTVVLNADGSFTYTGNNGYFGLDSLIYQVCDNGTPSYCDTATSYYRILKDNVRPGITAPQQQDVTEDTAIAVNTFSFADADAGNETVTVRLSVPAGRGTLAVTGNTGVTVKDSTGFSVLRGSITNINNLIVGNGITYTPPANESGASVPLTIYINDHGHTGSDPGTSGDNVSEDSTITMNLVIRAVNDAPVLTVPGDQSVAVNTRLQFRAAANNSISLADIDAGDGLLEVKLSVTGGILTLPETDSTSFINGTGNGQATFTFAGKLSWINAALASLEFMPSTGFIGEVTLQADVNDRQQTGSGTALTDMKQVRIFVGPQEPLVTGVTTTNADSSYKTGSRITLQVTFNKAVAVTGTPQLMMETGATDRPASYVSGSGSQTLVFEYTVQNGDESADLDYTTVNALLLNGGAIRNTAGTMDALLELPAPGSAGSVGGTANLIIDGVPPTIIAIEVPANGRYKPGDQLFFQVEVSEPLSPDFWEVPVLPVNIGGSLVNTFFMGTQDNTMVFTYTIPTGAFDGDGIQPSGNLQFPAGGIQDLAGNDLVPAIPGAGILAGVLVDGIAPVITAGQTFTIPENAAVGTPVGTIAATDAGALLPLQQWQITAQASPAVFAIDAATGSITVLNAGELSFDKKPVYDISVTVSDGLNTSLPVQVRINLVQLNRAPTLNPVPDVSVCAGAPVQSLQLTGITPGPEATQTVTLGISAAGDNFAQLTITDNGGGNATVQYSLKPGVTGETSVTVTVKDNGGTEHGGTDTFVRQFKVQASPPPAISIAGSPANPISKGDVAQLTASGAASYVWQAADGIVSGQNSAVLSVRPLQNTIYHVTGTTAAGCSGNASIEVTVKEDYKLDATNILTPNGDGINDRWVIRNIDAYPNNEVKIFDRAGRLLYTKKGYLNEWSGTVNGSPLQEGTYYYIVDFGPNLPKFKGFITIVRNGN